MLDDVTKKRINTLRQILVGKLPDPKAQVEQITNGLIYKFMNDMDQQSVSMGGKSTYFSGKFQKYSWKNLMDTKTSGVEKVKLYEDAVEQMYTNENLPELFREIFKNSFLPFKDPSTLNMFLKEINEFNYSNSEKLGDAFEYLLSFMGSQGDAGQFRTPRHIIDFIVEIVNPQKNETILDPACGTAGFLISSYKHILNQNTKKNLGDGLTASDRKKIGENLNGYDISPDMVKMSLVNMYLHKFTNPKINEYDTLSSEDRWNEYYDVILANPPFFSPKGGITPHNRFGVKSTKAEVLFVDYINEHLKPNGRAGIIVPEGIIFQTGNAYTQLRKKLIANSLIGVISLPAGIFKPYSGVKTSVLILDKKLNKTKEYIYFAKIKNDGFSLTTNRTQIDENDIPEAKQRIDKLDFSNDSLLKKIKKKEIIDGNILEYISNTKENTSIYEFKNLGEVADIKSGNPAPQNKELFHNGKYPFIRTSDVGAIKEGSIYSSRDYLNDKGIRNLKKFNKGSILFPKSGASTLLNHRVIMRIDGYVSSHLAVIKSKKEKVLDEYLFYLLKKIDTKNLVPNISYPSLNINEIAKIKIPIPDLKTQSQIIEELEEYQKIIDGCKQVIDNYKPTIDIDPSWEIKKLGDLCNIFGGGTPSKNQKEYWNNGNIKWLSCKHLDNDGNIIGNEFITKKGLNSSSTKLVKPGSVILVNRVSLGKVVFSDDEYAINQDLTGIHSLDENKIDNYFIFLYLMKIKNKFINDGQGVGVKGITRDYINKIQIPLPSIENQKLIIKEIKDELEIIEKNKLLISKSEEKINKKLNSIWSN